MLKWGVVSKDLEKGNFWIFLKLPCNTTWKKTPLLILLLSSNLIRAEVCSVERLGAFPTPFSAPKNLAEQRWLFSEELWNISQTTFMFSFSKQAQFRRGRRNRGVLQRGGKKEQKISAPNPTPVLYFPFKWQSHMSPALHAGVQLSYSFISLFIPVTFESFPTIPKVLSAHILYPQALGGIKIFLFVCLYV